MTEYVLLGVVLLILIGTHFLLKKIKNPSLFYIKLITAIGLILLIWLYNPEKNKAIRIVMTVIVAASLYKEYLSMKKIKSNR